MRHLTFILILAASGSLLAQKEMSNKQMEKLFHQEADHVEGETGAWRIIYGERVLLVLTDELNNRMRIFTPVVEESEVGDSEMRKMLKANFHSALDAKYSIYNGFVISAFTHPLKELTSGQLIDAMKQVVNLADTFGTTYSSTDLIFGGDEDDKRINQSPSKEKNK